MSRRTYRVKTAGTLSTCSRYRRSYNRELWLRKRFGTEMYFNREPEEVPVYEEGASYTNSQLTAMADQLLREDVRREICRDCGEGGTETGKSKLEKYKEVKNGVGEELMVEYAQYKCDNDHTWYKGEGKERGINGENPILFEEHIQSRKRREIYTVIGTPDPSIVQGIYNRVHPQGRKVNSKEQRERNGASFYR